MKNLHACAIAIVGMACRFPGQADNLDKYWENIRNKTDCIGPIPQHRWNPKILQDLSTDDPDTQFARVGGFVEDIEDFDAGFFGISPREAVEIDPQQRILLELSWRCMENAAISAQRLRQVNTGVYVGVINHDHERLILSDRQHIGAHSGLGRSTSIASNRISYCFDFSGPSLTIDTACSSSLTAVDAACKALESGEIDAAFAGGANAILLPESYIEFSRAAMLSKTGRCRTFDASADGFVRAEGGGLILLKRLSDALIDGDRIHAVVVSSVLNQDGRTAGIMAPSLDAQKTMMREALQGAKLKGADIGYVESHGTGTQVGDSIEAISLGEVYGQSSRMHKCPIGSVKTNIGHTEAAAGIAGLIKATLAVRQGEIPPNLHFLSPNPEIDFATLGIRVPVESEPWLEACGKPRIAAVNSFGFGGANAHAIVQQAPQFNPTPKSAKKSLFHMPLTASSQTDMDGLKNSIRHLSKQAPPRHPSLCRTSARQPRRELRSTLILSRQRGEKTACIEEFSAKIAQIKTQEQNSPPATAFVFNGIGAGWQQAGLELYSTEPLFESIIDLCDGIFQERHGISVIHDYFSKQRTFPCTVESSHSLHFSIQMGINELLRSWNIHPAAVVGHSVGEIAAACAAGVLDLVEAARITAERARILQQCSGRGSMLAAGITSQAAMALTDSNPTETFVAAINSKSSVTLAGSDAGIKAITSKLDEQGRFSRLLELPVAFHTPLIDSCEGQIVSRINDIEFKSPEVRWFSSVTGDEIDWVVGSEYWWDNFRHTVRFEKSMQACIQAGFTTFVEIGPHPNLSFSMAECLQDEKVEGHCTFALRKTGDDNLTIRSAVATLFNLGHNPDWEKINPAGEVCDFPLQPFRRKTYRKPISPTLNAVMGEIPNSDNASAESRAVMLDVDNAHWLNRHRIQGKIVMPAAGYVNLALEEASRALQCTTLVLTGVKFVKKLVLTESAKSVQSLDLKLTDLSDRNNFLCEMSVTSGNLDRQDALHASCELVRNRQERPFFDFQHLIQNSVSSFQPVDVERKLALLGLEGDTTTWQHGNCCFVSESEIVFSLIPNNHRVDEAEQCLLDPALLDTVFRTIIVMLDQQRLCVPVEIERLEFWGGDGSPVWCQIRQRTDSSAPLCFDVTVADQIGAVIAKVTRLTLKEINRRQKILPGKGTNARLLQTSLALHESFTGSMPPFGVTQDAVPRRSTRDTLDNTGQWDRIHQSVSPMLAELTAHYVGCALKQLRFPFHYEHTPLTDIEKFCNIDREQRVLFHALLDMLEDAGYVRINSASNSRGANGTRSGATVKSLCEIPSDPSQPLAQLIRNPDASEFTAEIQLIDLCGTSLAKVLTGDQTGLDALFPNGVTTALKNLYQHSPTCKLQLEQLTETVEHLLCNWQLARKCRILEIGGGTGALLFHLAPILANFPTEYTFTDISRGFVREASQRFSNVESVNFEVFDIDASFESQGLQSDSFDIVLAVDVLHLSRDIDRVFSQVRQMLVSGGQFLFVELTSEPVWAKLVFGMLRDWWHRTENVQHPVSPCRPVDYWLERLTQGGFTATETNPERQSEACLPHTMFSTQCVKKDLSQPNSVRTGESKSSVLIFADNGSYSTRFIDNLSAQYKQVVTAGDGFSKEGPEFRVRPNRIEDYIDLLDALKSSAKTPNEVVVMWNFLGLDDAVDSENSVATVCSALMSIAHLIQAFDRFGLDVPSITLITANAHQPTQTMEFNACLGNTLWSVGRTIRNEHPTSQCRIVDVDPKQEELIPKLCDFIQHRSDILESVLHCDGWRLPVIKDFDERKSSQSRHLIEKAVCSVPGDLSSVRFTDSGSGSQAIDNTQVLIQVSATALNFRDVMVALDALSAEAVQSGMMQGSLGMECAGTVTEVGNEVGDISVGDRVVALVPGSMKSQVVADEELVRRIPESWTFEQAVGLPAAYITALNCLEKFGNRKLKKSVLVHSAAGGVGLAMTYVALGHGATVYATAGSEEKSRYLELLGVEHVADSRSIAFADEILDHTNARGIDVIINTLGGELATANARVLKPGGVYIELGKHPDRQQVHDSVKTSNPTASIHIIDIDKMWRDSPGKLSDGFQAVMEQVECGSLPALPHTVFPARNIQDAFRFMADARHIGKVVVNLSPSPSITPESNSGLKISSRYSYVVAGGTRGFGLATVRWLSDSGARFVVVVGRFPDQSPPLRQLIQQLNDAGTTVRTIAADLAQLDDLKHSLQSATSDMPPIKGVFHCAMEIEDRMLNNLTINSCQKTLKPKMLGALNLHQVTEHLALDFFVMYSSIAAVLGPPGQVAYSAANAFLDSFSKYLQEKGVPARSINWGAVSDYGYVADNQGRYVETIERFGISPLPAEAMLSKLPRILGCNDGANLIVSGGEWAQSAIDTLSMDIAHQRVEQNGYDSEESPALITPTQMCAGDVVRTCFSKVLGIPETSIDVNESVLDLGMDSLLAVELSQLLRSEGDLEIGAADLLQQVTIQDIIERLTPAVH